MIEQISLSELTLDPENARYHGERNLGAIKRSLEAFGGARSVVVDGQGVVRAGNGTVAAARELGLTQALVVDVPDDAILVARKSGWSEAQSVAYALADNVSTDLSVFVDDALQANLEHLQADGFPLEATGFSAEELDLLLGKKSHSGTFLEGEDDGDAEGEEDADDDRPMPQDMKWESDNEWGIPTLDVEMQATHMPAPIVKWGTSRRDTAHQGSYHFYTDDYKFWGLHRNPWNVVDSGCQVAVEPNYSTWPEMSRAEVLWGVYSKRLVARFWQSQGIKVYVDLNVDRRFADLAMLGVPHDWTAFTTRWHEFKTFEDLNREWSWACSMRLDAKLVVFGGGKEVQEECARKGWGWVAEDSDRARGRV